MCIFYRGNKPIVILVPFTLHTFLSQPITIKSIKIKINIFIILLIFGETKCMVSHNHYRKTGFRRNVSHNFPRIVVQELRYINFHYPADFILFQIFVQRHQCRIHDNKLEDRIHPLLFTLLSNRQIHLIIFFVLANREIISVHIYVQTPISLPIKQCTRNIRRVEIQSAQKFLQYYKPTVHNSYNTD